MYINEIGFYADKPNSSKQKYIKSTVAENVVLGSEPKSGMRFDFDKACSVVREIADTYGLAVDPREKVENLSVGIKQRVEILKAL